MNEIRTTKIDGQEFVPYKDYRNLKNENIKLKSDIEAMIQNEERYKYDIKNLEEENKKLKSDLEQFSEPYKKYRDYEKEELAESCYDLERENQKLKERIKKLEYL